MFFLIRTAFWLSIVVMLLPTPESAKVPEAQFSTGQAISAASATVSDMGQFCSRQPAACEVGSSMLSYLGHKAVASAKWAYEAMTSKSDAGPTALAKTSPRVIDIDNSQNTLTASDAAPSWRGPVRQAEAKH
jgi:creatinine amidohydrolase/Fe(II)-dependent formamide hydrolase-like protein